MKWFVYLVKCIDNYLYTGITTNPNRRVWEHNNKFGAKSLKGKIPVKLVYKKCYNSKKEAAKREREIKGWKKDKKLALIKNSIIDS